MKYNLEYDPYTHTYILTETYTHKYAFTAELVKSGDASMADILFQSVASEAKAGIKDAIEVFNGKINKFYAGGPVYSAKKLDESGYISPADIYDAYGSLKTSTNQAATSFHTYAGGYNAKGDNEFMKDMQKKFPALKHKVKCPGCSSKDYDPVFGSVVEGKLASVIVCLNDKHGWTREQIADWLETTDLDLRVKE